MQPFHIIKCKEDLLNHFGSSQKLQILNLKQMGDLLALNVPPEVWEDASNRNLLSFNKELIQQTIEFTFQRINIEYFHLLSFLTNLTQLDLSGNNISGISAISKLKNMKKLYLSGNCIEDISAFQSLPDLTHLNLQQNKLTSYTLALPNLIELKIGHNQLQDKTGLQYSPNLQDVNLCGTETADLRTIPHQLFGLKTLELYHNNLVEISHLSNFVDLQSLNISYNKLLQNIGPLKFCPQLTKLSIAKTNVADIWPLQFMKNLQTLDMANTAVIDLHPLQHLYQLQRLSSDNAHVIDVSPLSDLTQLDNVSFISNQISNVDVLKQHNNYQKFRFSSQKIPTTNGLIFYNKILSVHNSQKQIKKLVQENRISQFRGSMIHHEYIKIKINKQNKVMIQKIELIFSQDSQTDQQ
ncbi:Conserved_hypothetical protein [Hexamita inflata]|uniref:Chaoptin n=1 Tax=Hexamita inflata TaxID=28002 RepID=A0AA86RFU3_9EUKA|nr:Conserved hypothetical protein [Hexamita inflata]